ncbi:MAG: aminodeoxychorismate/anthranilate synthase component II [bacterium]
MSPKVLIIDNYDSFVWNIVQLLEACGVQDLFILKNDELMDKDTDDYHKVIISPGPGIASESGDMPRFLELNFTRRSILGICLGHEAIAELFGARLVKMPEPWHGIKGPGIITRDDPLFKELPKQVSIGHYHSWILEKETLPDDFNILMEDEEGRIMAIRHKEHDLVGLQFHPESIMTDYGKEMMENWVWSVE